MSTMRRLARAAALLSVLIAPLLPAQEAPRRNVSGGELLAEQACFDVQRYDLRLKVDPEARTIEGTLGMVAQVTAPCARIALDLDAALQVRLVSVFENRGVFEHKDGRIWIELGSEYPAGSELTVGVRYGGSPRVARNPPWQGGFTWASTKDGKPWIATSCQGEGADLWWPCKDHPSDKPEGMELFVTVPDGLVVASNGTLQGQEQADKGWRTFHWRIASPISNYCVALNIAPYQVLTQSYQSTGGGKTPVQFYVLPESAAKARRFLPQFISHLRWFEETLGPYPFRHEKYGIAETPHLGMEHQTIIAYGNKFQDETYDWLHHHELSHEWWGNLVTCRDWKDMWIHEGFGTYMQALYLEHLRGKDAYFAEVRKWRPMNRSPVAPRETRDSQQIYFGGGGSNDIYFKGALVLHSLRWLLGDEKFLESLRRFCYPTKEQREATDGSQVRLVDTDDYVRLCSEIAGEDLGWFFEVYVRQPRLPRLSEELQDGVLALRWQAPGELPFSLPVPVRVAGKVHRVAMPDGVGELQVGAREFEVDPERWLLRERRDR
jgi:aminopeptidase N